LPFVVLSLFNAEKVRMLPRTSCDHEASWDAYAGLNATLSLMKGCFSISDRPFQTRAASLTIFWLSVSVFLGLSVDFKNLVTKIVYPLGGFAGGFNLSISLLLTFGLATALGFLALAVTVFFFLCSDLPNRLLRRPLGFGLGGFLGFRSSFFYGRKAQRGR